MDYGKALKIARAIAGLQQKELANRAGIDPSHISLLEAKRRQPSVGMLQKLSRALGIPHHLLVLLAAESDDLEISDPAELRRVSESLTRFLLGNVPSKGGRLAKRSVSR
jgi:transcriptional regulator with XRE-family HTH domain